MKDYLDMYKIDINLKFLTKDLIISLYEMVNEIDEKEINDFFNNDNLMFRYYLKLTQMIKLNTNLYNTIYL